MSIALWHVEKHGAFFYCTRKRTLLPEAVWCTSELHADDMARQLNILDTVHASYPAL